MKYVENQIQTPIENLDLVADVEQNFVVFMKGGEIFKNTIKRSKHRNYQRQLCK